MAPPAVKPKIVALRNEHTLAEVAARPISPLASIKLDVATIEGLPGIDAFLNVEIFKPAPASSSLGRNGIAGRNPAALIERILSREEATAAGTPDTKFAENVQKEEATGPLSEAPPSEAPPSSGLSGLRKHLLFAQEMHVRDFLEFYTGKERTSLETISLRQDTVGHVARDFRRSLNLLQDRMRMYTERGSRRVSGNEELWEMIASQVNEMESSGYESLTQAYGAKVRQIGAELQPLKVALAALETRATGMQYEFGYARPESLSRINLETGNLQASFGKLSASELTTGEITVPSRLEACRVVRDLQSQGLLSPHFEWHGTEATLPIQVAYARSGSGETVTGFHSVPVKMTVAYPASKSGSALNPAEIAEAGYDLAWGRDHLWHGGKFPVLMESKLASVSLKSEPAPLGGVFDGLRKGLEAKTSNLSDWARLKPMLQALQAVYEECPTGDARRTVILSTVRRMENEMKETRAPETSLPVLWLTAGQAFSDLRAKEIPMSPKERVLSGVLSMSEIGDSNLPTLIRSRKDSAPIDAFLEASGITNP